MPTFKSLYPSYEVPTGDLWEALFEQDLKIPDTKTLWIEFDTSKTLSFGEIRDKSRQFGAKLVKHYGLKKGDHVLFSSLNTVEVALAILGAIYVGITVVMVHPALPEQAVKVILASSQPRLALASLEAAPKLEACGLGAENIIILSYAELPETKNYQCFNFGDINVSTDVGIDSYRVKSAPKDTCFLCYTSGTTQPLPKGVKVTHQALCSTLIQADIMERQDFNTKTDSIVTIFPWTHIFGLSSMFLIPLYLGLPNIILPAFDLAKFLTSIQNHKATHIYVSPPIIDILTTNPIVQDFDLSSIKYATSGGSPISVAAIHRAKSILGFGTRQALGSTETIPICIQKLAEWDQTIGSVGKLCSNMELNLISPSTGEELDYDSEEPGELWVRGSNVNPWTYHNNDAANKEHYSEDGQWYKTGDLGKITKNRDIYLFGRVTDLIHIVGKDGVKKVLTPDEVETTLRHHADVRDTATKVVKSDVLATDILRAYVQLVDGVEGSEEKRKELLAFALKETQYEEKGIPLQLAIVPHIQRSPAGKVLRWMLP